MKFTEPIISEGKPNWLIVTQKETYPIDDRTPEEIIKRPQEPIIKTSFEVKPEGLWQCQKCGAMIQSNPEPPIECYKDQNGCERHTNFKPILGVINPDLWILPTWEDLPREELDYQKTYTELLDLIKRLLVFSSEIEYKIYALWIISTWKLETWDSVGFPIFIGIPNSGKTRALRIIAHLGYRCPKASGITADSIPRLTHNYNATLLIDEAHSKLNPKTESGSRLLEFIKDSYKKGSIKMVCDNNDQTKIITYRNFGFKAIAGEKSFNPALLSRGLIFYMDKADPEIAKLSYVADEINRIRTILLNYRFKTNDPPDLGNDFVLKGRNREIFESIIATGKHIGIDVSDIIEYAQNKETIEEEALQGTYAYEILQIIKEFEENPHLSDSPEKIKTDDIIDKLGWFTDDKKEDHSARMRLGYQFKDMGLQPKRSGGINYFDFKYGNNENRLKILYKRYKLNEIQQKLAHIEKA